MFEINLYDDSNPRKKRKVKSTLKRELVKVEPVSDSSDIGYIKSLISEKLKYLNGVSYGDYFTVKVLSTKKNCFRATVFDKSIRKVLIDFFVEKGGDKEYVFTPPLEIQAFTVNNYENRSGHTFAASKIG